MSDHPGYVAGRWYAPYGMMGLATGNSMNTIRFTLLTIEERVTISDLGARVTTVSAGGLFGLAIYAMSATTKLPTGTPLASVMGLSTATATAVTGALAANVQLEPGQYWGAVIVDNTTAIFHAVSGGSGVMLTTIGDATATNTLSTGTNALAALSITGHNYATGFTDVSASTFAAISTTANAAFIVKVASVP